MGKLLRVVGLTFAVLLLAMLGFARFSGALLQSPDGKSFGYYGHTDEWLFNEYPTFPAQRDGPYVLINGEQRIALTLEPRPGSEAVAVRAPVTTQVEVVVDDTAATRFVVPLRSSYPRQKVSWPMPEKWLAVSDFEGNFTAATKLLRAQGVIDEHLRWSFGDGHLVLVGDMVDRGENVVPLLWLLYKLEGEARAAGGGLHYVLGNHEIYLLQGRPEYAHTKYYGTARVAGIAYGDLWSRQTELGRWLRSKPMLIRIGDTLFTHGGISPQVLATGLDLAKIDALAARYSDVNARADNPGMAVILGDGGLVWYRGLAKGNERQPIASADHVDRLLAHFDAKRIAIGHTLAEHVGYSYSGRALRTDVHHASGVSEGILCSDGELWRVDAAGGRSPLGMAVNLRA